MDKKENKQFTTLVFGASLNPERYSHSAVLLLEDKKKPVVAIGGREGYIGTIKVKTGHPDLSNIHTITMYMGSTRTEAHEEYLLSLNPKRIIFNPGAENQRLTEKAEEQGIEVINACTLVMLRTGQYDPEGKFK